MGLQASSLVEVQAFWLSGVVAHKKREKEEILKKINNKVKSESRRKKNQVRVEERTKEDNLRFHF